MRLSRIPIGICALAVLLGGEVTPASAVGAPGDLYVTSGDLDLVRVYSGSTGDYVGVFTASMNGQKQLGIHFGAANNRVLVGHESGGVDEFDATTGAFIKTYNPGGGLQYAGIHAPDGNVYIGDHSTDDIRKYDSTTGAYIATMRALPDPMDMEYGPNGNLYVCSYSAGSVHELDPNTLATVSSWSVVPGLPPGFAVPIDVAFLPVGRILVTAAGSGSCWVFDAAHQLVHRLAGGFAIPFGIAISPNTGRILIADGISPFPPEGMIAQVYGFLPDTYASPDAPFASLYLDPHPEDRIVDIAFRPQDSGVPAAPTTWGRIKGRYR